MFDWKKLDRKNTKDAWMWVHAASPDVIGYPGVIAELFFSSPKAFYTLLDRPLDPYEALVRVKVPADFDYWDFIPNDY